MSSPNELLCSLNFDVMTDGQTESNAYEPTMQHTKKFVHFLPILKYILYEGLMHS